MVKHKHLWLKRKGSFLMRCKNTWCKAEKHEVTLKVFEAE